MERENSARATICMLRLKKKGNIGYIVVVECFNPLHKPLHVTLCSGLVRGNAELEQEVTETTESADVEFFKS